MKDAKKVLESKGISPSLQRVIILKFLQDHPMHPTVEDVYTGLIEEIPTLSKTTVYNTLKLFEQHGIVYQLSIAGNESHYDYAEEYHAHLCCVRCGRIYDLEIEDKSDKRDEIEGHQITGKEVIYHGICRKCRKK